MHDLQNDLNVAAARDFSEASLEDLKRLVVLMTQLRCIALKECDRIKEMQRLILTESSPMPIGARKAVSFIRFSQSSDLLCH